MKYDSVSVVDSYQQSRELREGNGAGYGHTFLGCARGAALLAAASRGLPVFEYAPRRVKQAVVGRGGAEKAQVAFMVRALLGLSETPPADAADALAVGLTHFQALDRARLQVGDMEQI